MRITSETLFKIANDTIGRRTRSDRDIIAAYVHGSLLEGDPLLGGTTDIDLFFIHAEPAPLTREIQRLTDEIHLDIAHHTQSDYRHTRDLRLHPWLGPTLSGCKILYDPQHLLDFIQAGVRSQFNRPDNVLRRARGQAEHARQIWLSLHDLANEPALHEIVFYLRAVEHAANAIALLSGSPLTERRFLLQFPLRAEAIERPGLFKGLLGLLGAQNVDSDGLRAMLPAWETAYKAISPTGASPRLHPDRRLYYRSAFEKILQSERPHCLLWPLLRTWTEAISLLSPEGAERQAWQDTFFRVGLMGANFSQRVAALDAYLDTIEETLDEWARVRGL